MTIKVNILTIQENLAAQQALLKWYEQHGRVLPWRAHYSQKADFYHVVVSEFMLQQTTVSTVIPYFKKFIEKWPDFKALSEASLDDVLQQWQGLGYYRRARFLWQSAKILKNSIPTSLREWQGLPGFGPYMVAAVGSIAFEAPLIALDGNLKRIFSRLFKENDEKQLRALAQSYLHESRTGDINQALMDLGSGVCTPKAPKCFDCPLQHFCKSYQEKGVAFYPAKKIKPVKPTRYVYAYKWVLEGKIVLEKREGQGLLQGGLMGVPLSGFMDQKPENFIIHVKHTFTHFHLYVHVCVDKQPLMNSAYTWVALNKLEDVALPVLMQKIIKNKD